MRFQRSWRRALLLPVAAAVLVVGFALSGVGNGLALLVFALAIAALLCAWLLLRLGAALPASPDFPRLLIRQERKEGGVEQLESVQRLVSLAGSSRSDLLRLRPLVVEIAAARLSRRYGVDLQKEPERARSLLAGTRVWEIAREDAGGPADRDAPGWSQEELERLVDELEGL